MQDKEEMENNEDLLRRISKEKYKDEWFIENAILSYKNQQEKTYTFFRDDKQEDLLRKYNWCQRPCDSNMSLRRFVANGEIEGYMSESLVHHYPELVQVDLNEFIHKFVKLIVKENLSLKDKVEQLEAEKQEVIEKLEKEIEADEEELKYNNLSYYGRGCLQTEKEILDIVKGVENERDKI